MLILSVYRGYILCCIYIVPAYVHYVQYKLVITLQCDEIWLRFWFGAFISSQSSSQWLLHALAVASDESLGRLRGNAVCASALKASATKLGWLEITFCHPEDSITSVA